MSSKTWRKLAEAVGIEAEGPNWQKAAKQRNMQRYGTQSSRDKGTPLDLYNKMKAQKAAAQPPNMTPRPGGLNIPAGTDRPGQINPLAASPRPVAGGRPPLSNQGSQASDDMDDLLAMFGGEDDI